MPDSLTPSQLSRADELNLIGAKFHTEKGNLEMARLHYLAALKHEPDHKQALQNLGAALIALDKLDAAASISRRAVKADPNSLGAWGNLAVAYLGLRRYQDAIDIFEKIIDKLPKDMAAPLLHNYGLAHHMLMHWDEAMKLYNQALALQPNLTPVKSDRGLCMLAQERILEGLGQYEIRWDILAKSSVWDLDIPEWKGESLKGKKVLLHHEQGFGDSLMLARFIKPIMEMSDDVTFAGPHPLQRIFEDSFPGLKFIEWNDKDAIKAGNFDVHSPMLSLMRWLKIKPREISNAPYLKARPWEISLKLPNEFKIGINWSSGDHGPWMEKRRRKVALESLIPISEIPGVKLVSLNKHPDPKPGQMTATPDEIINLGMEGIIFDCMARVEDFADTAVLANQLDLIIGVDSAVIHLAGAIGKPTIMLSPYTRCWRWWNANDEGGWTGEPWYKDMKVFPQSADGSWNAAVAQVVEFVSTLRKDK